jgi:hypothetical protein
MLAPAITFYNFIIGVHVLAVVLAFGILFLYPLMGLVGAQVSDQARPWWHRFHYAIHTKVQSPALVLVLAAGIYLTADSHQWKQFFVQWGIAAVIVIAGIGGALITPRERKLIELSDSELTAAGGGPVTTSVEYNQTLKTVRRLQDLQLLITIVTIVIMTTQP